MNKLSKFRDDYINNIKNIISNRNDTKSSEDVMSDAVGGSFDSIGYLEKKLLQQHGLSPDHFLVDVGCGSGRLLSQLTANDIAHYLGTDISEDLLNYSQQYLVNENWQLKKVDDCSIPLSNDTADMVCMFSVITHLMHQQTYQYFKEASRVLKSGGMLVVSFLEFRHAGLWPIFEQSIDVLDQEGRLDIFVDRDGLRLWGEKSGFKVNSFIDGETPHIKIDKTVTFDNGLQISDIARLGPTGQSIAVFEKQ